MADSTLKLEFLREYTGNRRVFIETGTARGEGIQTALEFGRFDKLYSIEAKPDVYEAACKRFVNENKVDLLLGDGAKVLPAVLAEVQEPAVFWLDSHWGIGEEPLAPGISPCPLIGELCAIAEHPIKDHVILIDDVRHFWRGIPQWENITVSDILAILVDAGDYWIKFETGIRKGDIIVATPDPRIIPVCKPAEAVEEYENLR